MKTNTQSKGIGFKNFRRFIDFPMLKFGQITYMVGKNNSGKSTMVKALLLVMDYLQNQLSNTFSFESEVLEDVNIVTFGRAKNNAIINPIIIYDFILSDFNFHIEISGDDEATAANIRVLKIEDLISGVTIEINHSQGEVIVSRDTVEEKFEVVRDSSIVQQLEKAVKSLKEDLDAVKDKRSKKAFKLQSDYSKALEKLKDAKKIKKQNPTITSNNYKVNYSLAAIYGEESYNLREDNPLSYIIERLIYLNDINAKKSPKEIKNLADVVALNRNTSHLSESINRIIDAIENEQYFYIGANPSKQSALFYLRDKNNALAQAIHKFYQLGITTKKDDNEELRFVQEWMNKFDVGFDLDIKFIAGEAYDLKIFETKTLKENNISSHLADKGMGSLQVMSLILRIASLIRIHKNHKNKQKCFTILIEEPELNLHPNLQSKLTEFFYQINKDYGFQFIIETHSEYIIRQSQLLGLEKDYFIDNELNVNPFKVYYFHKEEGPYEMEFTEQGKFKKDFGPGFYNEASNISIEIIKNIRKNKS